MNNNSALRVDGKEYPYLFWEAKSDELNYTFSENSIDGFMIETDSISSFFEGRLDQIGLNQTEKTDFITYWGPVLSHKKYAFVQFIVDSEYDDKVAQLDISPKPDCSKRVFILCSSLDDPNIGININPQSFEPLVREGFTLIEWGGATIDFNRLGH